jgi:hypothetical protein
LESSHFQGAWHQEDIEEYNKQELYNGLVLLGDDETRSYWDHITGECIYGPLVGKKMDVFPIQHTSVKRALKQWPNLHIALSTPPIWMRIIAPMMQKGRKRGFLPPMFRKTMDIVDPRLSEMTSGLGIITESVQRFYPVEFIKKAGGHIADVVDGRDISIDLHQEDQVPHAVYAKMQYENDRPMQIFTRWYGFYLTYPQCQIYSLQ